MSNIRCAAWRVTLADGATFVREYATPQPAEVALACVPNVTRAEPVGELGGAGIPASPVATLTRRTRPAALEIPDETPRWSWPELLTEIVTRHFEGAGR